MTRKEAIDSMLSAAYRDRNIRETPPKSNRHARIDKALRLCGLGTGHRWCAAIVALWGSETLGTAYPMPLSADCDVLLSFARRKRICHATPERGDIFLLLDSSDRDDAFHTGLVSSVESGHFETWEGNTNKTGSPDGDGVYSRTRTDTAQVVFARWVDLLEDIAEEEEVAWSMFVGTVSPRQIWLTIRDGVGYCRLRTFLETLHGKDRATEALGYDETYALPSWEGRRILNVRHFRDNNGDFWVSVADIVDWDGSLTLKRDPVNKLLRVVRKA